MASLSDEQVSNLIGPVMGADGGCPYCVVPIIEALERVFPEIDWMVEARRHAEKNPNPGFYWIEDESRWRT